MIGAAILTIMIGFSGSFEAILGMRLIQGLLLAAFPSLIIAYINEEFEPFNVGTVIGIYISGTTVGGLFGRLVVSAILILFPGAWADCDRHFISCCRYCFFYAAA